jgi:hypothetical protein
MTWTLASLILLALAVLGGVVLLALRLRGSPAPLGIALVHGAVALSGVATLAIFVFNLVSFAGSRAIVGLMPLALALVAGAALGGLVLLACRIRETPLPRGLLYVHALAGVTGYACLLGGAVTGW